MVCLEIEHHGGTSTGLMMMTQDRLGSSQVMRLELNCGKVEGKNLVFEGFVDDDKNPHTLF